MATKRPKKKTPTLRACVYMQPEDRSIVDTISEELDASFSRVVVAALRTFSTLPVAVQEEALRDAAARR